MRSSAAAMAALLAALASPARGAEVSSLLVSQLQQLAAAEAPGQLPVGPINGGFMATRQTMAQYVSLQAGRCYLVFGVGGPGVTDLDLVLYDPNGKRAISDVGFDATPRLSYCAQWSGAYRVDATVKRGAGEIAVQVYTPGGAPEVARAAELAGGDLPPPDPALLRRPAAAAPSDALAAHLDDQARALAPGARRVGDFYRGYAPGKGGRSDWSVALEGGRCYTFLGAGGAGVEHLSLYLWDPSGRRVADRRTKAPESVMGFCASFVGPYHLQAKVERGAGEYRVGVYGAAR